MLGRYAEASTDLKELTTMLCAGFIDHPSPFAPLEALNGTITQEEDPLSILEYRYLIVTTYLSILVGMVRLWLKQKAQMKLSLICKIVVAQVHFPLVQGATVGMSVRHRSRVERFSGYCERRGAFEMFSEIFFH